MYHEILLIASKVNKEFMIYLDFYGYIKQNTTTFGESHRFMDRISWILSVDFLMWFCYYLIGKRGEDKMV